MKDKTIIIIIVVGVLLLVSAIVNVFKPDDDTPAESSSRIEYSREEKSETTQSTTELATEDSTSVEAQKCTDMELLTIGNHPTFYGSIEKAHEVWDEFSAEDTVMIREAGYYEYKDAILVLDCFKGRGAYTERDSDTVNGVYIRFKNFVEEKEVKFQEALSVASEYFPYEIMSEHYNLFESCYQNIGTEEEPYYKYFINYMLNDESRSEYDNDYPYDIWVSVAFYVDSDDNVDSISISPGRTSNARHEPEKNEWGYDFISN